MTDTMDRADATPRTGYAPVNGLRMYYEVHGDDRGADRTPVLLLNGAYMTTADFGPLLPGLAGGRTVVVTDLQGHGRTNDADRPITYEGLADTSPRCWRISASRASTPSATASAAPRSCSSPCGTRMSSTASR